jgi:choline dehydrogenase-like flavoprotein
MTDARHHDAVIVGTGAGGGTLAHRLAPSGKCVLLLGRDPASSALDVDCKAHDLDNLYVVDTSFFPSIGAVNPSLTAMANALRVGDHLTGRLR